MSKTPKKDKKKKSKRKSGEISSPIIPTSNSDKGSSEKKKGRKKKDRKNNEVNTRDRLPTTTIQQPLVDASSNNNGNGHLAGSILSILSTTNYNQSKDKCKNSPYQIKTIIGSAALLPTSLNSVSSKIKSLLHSLLLRYDGNLGGVLLSLEDDVTILPMESSSVGGGSKALVGGQIIDDLPYVHYRFRVHGLVFCPKVGMKVRLTRLFVFMFMLMHNHNVNQQFIQSQLHTAQRTSHRLHRDLHHINDTSHPLHKNLHEQITPTRLLLQ